MPRLRIVTFNIAHARGLSPIQGLTSQRKLRLNLRRIAALLDRLAPDIVALQEVDECSRWAGNFDHLDYLRVHAGYPHAVFGINNRRTGLLNLSYGNAVLSRHPILAAETVVFGQRSMGEKGFLYVELDVAGRCVPVVNLHLHHSSREQRLRQLHHLLAWLREKHRERGAGWVHAARARFLLGLLQHVVDDRRQIESGQLDDRLSEPTGEVLRHFVLDVADAARCTRHLLTVR